MCLNYEIYFMHIHFLSNKKYIEVEVRVIIVQIGIHEREAARQS